ncbi:MAG TPA: IMP dehydrogenase, partial [Alteromonas australica]
MLRIIQEALTFDDVLLVPGHSTVLPHTANLQTRLTRGVTLNIPMVSAAMDTVSEARLAIALAQEGGIGFIHKNMKPEEQAKHVHEVKKYESGVVSDPVTVTKDATIGEVLALSKQKGYSGFPVTDEDNNLIGIVTGRDLRFEKRLELPISNVMTGKEDLVTVKEGASSDVVLDLMHEHRIEKILVVDDAFKLTGLITVKDFQKAENKPNACKDSLGRLRVGAAVSVGPGTDERIALLVEAGVDVLLIDTSHGHSQGVIDRVKKVRADYPDVQIIAGNVATGDGA